MRNGRLSVSGVWLLLVTGGLVLAAVGAVGQWVDEIVLTQEPSTSAAIAQLAADAIDVYAFAIGDFILGIILTFDRAKPENGLYDEAYLPAYNSFMSHFRGVRVITDDPDYPLIIETYSTLFTLDAELGVDTWFPYYAQGPGFWHVLALAIQAEADKKLAFSSDKSKYLGVEWTNLIDGPSLPILERYLQQAVLTGYIPYAPTLGAYITQDEASERWANLDAWYSTMGHFWVANGPYYLAQFDAVAKNILLKRFPDYAFTGERMQFLVD